MPGYAHLEMDNARAAILPNAAHTRDDRCIAYRAIFWTAAHLLRYTDIVICDGGFGQRERGPRRVIEFTAPLETVLRLHRERQSSHPGPGWISPIRELRHPDDGRPLALRPVIVI